MSASRFVRAAVAALAVSDLAACDGQILVGADPNAVGLSADASFIGDAAAPSDGGITPLSIPWSTGFETEFSDWSQPPTEGFCYLTGLGTFSTVMSPVHTGLYAAAFTVNVGSGAPSQARCLRQGGLPPAAYYGAWYYVPQAATNTGNWNLLHWQGANGVNGIAHGLWDVSLVNEANGAIDTSVFDFLRMRSLDAGAAIPIAAWFHLEVFLQRSSGDAGAFTLYLDGQPVVQLSGLSTDDTLWGQWHVGNYATALSPAVSTIYVDDVTIGTAPSSP